MSWSLNSSAFLGESLDGAGSKVALSGDSSTMAIASPGNDNSGGTDSGCVRVYNYSNSVWSLTGTIFGGAQDEYLADSVSLSYNGLTLAIGALNYDGDSSENNESRGAVRIYSYDSSDWSLTGTILGETNIHSRLGNLVALSADGTIVAVTRRDYNIPDSYNEAGYVKIFNLINGEWIQKGNTIFGESHADRFGASLALSADGSTVAARSYGKGNLAVADPGRVRVFKFSVEYDTWLKVGDDIEGIQYESIGNSVSLNDNGSILAIGSTESDLVNKENAGRVRVYKLNGTDWSGFGQDIDGEAEHDYLGSSVSLSSDGLTLAIGVILADPVNKENAGRVRVYKHDGTNWSKFGQDIDGEAANETIGTAVSLSGDGLRLAIGVPSSNSYAGNVRVYDYAATATIVVATHKTELSLTKVNGVWQLKATTTEL